MSLFDSLKAAFGQLAGSEAGALIGPALNALGMSNLQSLIDELRAAGLDDQIQAWAKGQTAQPLTPEEIDTIVNNPQVQELAKHVGIDPKAALDLIAKFLPQIVSHAAQNGLISTTK
jgi:uncharacterized protein YidB (DUF937 family)